MRIQTCEFGFVPMLLLLVCVSCNLLWVAGSPEYFVAEVFRWLRSDGLIALTLDAMQMPKILVTESLQDAPEHILSKNRSALIEDPQQFHMLVVGCLETVIRDLIEKDDLEGK